MDRRFLRSVRTRPRVIERALAQVEAGEFDTTTVDRIAAAAGISQRTFFHHFPSKEDVLFDGYADRLEDATRRFRDHDGRATLWEALADGSMAIVDAIEQDESDFFLRRFRLYEKVPALKGAMLRITEEWIDTMVLAVAERMSVDPRLDIRPRLAVTVTNAANRTALAAWTETDATIPLRDMFVQVLEAIRPAIDRIEQQPVTALRQRC